MKVFTKLFALSVAKKRGAMRALRPTLCAFLSFFSVLLFQCGNKDEAPAVPADVKVSITAAETTVTFPSAGGNYEVKITSSGDWNVKEEIAWLEATKVDNTLLQVTCEENTGDERSDKVTATIKEESVEITVTQSQPLGTLSTDSYTISSSEATNASLVLDVSFETAAAEWWITGEDGAPIPTFTSASPSSDSKADVSSKTFTYSIGANGTGTAIPVSLELHISGETGGASLTILPFTVTQGETLITALAPPTFSVEEASAGSHTLTFTSLTLTGSATHWWLTTDEANVSVSPGADSKTAKSESKVVTITVPRNAMATEKEYSIVLHVGSSDRSLDVRSFTVTQPARLASVASDELGPYNMNGTTVSSLDLSDETSGLGLSFESSAVEWWITGEGGGSIPAEISSLTPSSAQTKATTTLTFTLTACTTSGGCDYSLALNVAKTSGGDAADRIPLTIHQGESLITNLDNSYNITSAAAGEYTITLTGLTFDSKATHWWITAKSALPEGANVAPDAEDKKATSDPKTVTLTIPRNATTQTQTYELFLYAGTSSAVADPALDVYSLSTTQPERLAQISGDVLGPYSVSGGNQTIDLSSALRLSFESAAVDWWMTAADGSNTFPTGFTNVDPISTGKDQTSMTTCTFTLPVCNITQSQTTCEYSLEIHVSGSSDGDAADRIPFTVIQGQDLITSPGSVNTITSAAAGEYTITFTGLVFDTQATHWWVSTDESDVSVEPDTNSKAATSAVTKTFSINVPRNETDKPKEYSIFLHAGKSNTQGDPAFDQRTYTVTQPARLANVSSSTLGPYVSNEVTSKGVNLVSHTEGLNLSFEDTNDYWWVTNADGTDVSGLTSVTPSSSRMQANNTTATLTFTLPACTSTTTDCTYELAINVAEDDRVTATDFIPFTITQSKTLAVVTDTEYLVSAGGGTGTIILTGLNFASTAKQWWITGANGGARPSELTSTTLDSKVTLTQGSLPSSFDYVAEENTGVARDIVIEIRIASTAGEPALTIIPITLKQSAGEEVTLSTTSYNIPGDADEMAEVTFTGIAFRSDMTHWWITAANDGDAANTIEGITSVSHDGSSGKRQTTHMISFTMNVTMNPFAEVRIFALTLHAGGNTGTSEGSVPFTVTQAAGITPTPPGLISIGTLEQLSAIRYDLDGNGEVDDNANAMAYKTTFPGLVSSNMYTGYKLMRDLDFNVSGSYASGSVDQNWSAAEGGSGWEPIGFYTNRTNHAAFTGIFDGGGNTISNLFINRGSTGYVGLFGYTSGGSVKNVGLMGPVVTGNYGVGGLAGRNGSTISACYVSEGTMTGTQNDRYVGGMIGWNHGPITACYVSGGTVTTGTSSGFTSAGGMIGYHEYDPITACYVVGVTVRGAGSESNIGGLTGYMDAGRISFSYAGEKNYANLTGENLQGYIENSYYQTATVPENTDRAKTVSQLRTPTDATGIYENWNITRDLDEDGTPETLWHFGSASDFPKLRADFNGDGSIDNADLSLQTTSYTVPTVSFTQATRTVTEGLTVRITMSVSEAPGGGLTYSIPIVEGAGTTAQDTDYDLILPTSIDISGSDTEVTFYIMIKVDAPDAGEILELAFDNMLSDKVSLNAGSQTTTQITINESPATLPTVEFGSATYSSDEGTVLTVTVEVSEAPGADLKYVIPVEVLTTDGEHTAETTDYLLSSGTNRIEVIMSGTATSKTFDMILLGDNVSDNGEAIKLGFDMPSAIGLREGTNTTTLITINNATPTPMGLIPVTNLEQLNAIRYDLDGDGNPSGDFNTKALYIDIFPALAPSAITYSGYKLMKNLDFDAAGSYASGSVDQNWSEGEGGSGWEPIGFFNNHTTGTFDGQGNTISNLFINRGSNNVGLFGIVGRNGSVKNVGLEDPVVTGYNWVGSLVGRNVGGTIIASYVSGGTVNGSSQVGGLIGDNDRYRGDDRGGRITSCYVSGGTVNGSSQVGGLIGDNASTISTCYVSGGTVITGTGQDVGGLAGRNYSSATISASYVLGGTVNGSSQVGGLVGNSGGTIRASYVSGETVTTGTGSNVGGLVGRNYRGSTITVCYVSGGTVNGSSQVGGLVGQNDIGTISACYVSEGTMTGTGENVGGLVGDNSSSATITASYAGGMNYDNLVGNQEGTVTNSYYQAATSSSDTDTAVPAKTQSALQTPIDYTGIYVDWDDLDGNGETDSETFWEFGSNSQYPVLRIDADRDGDTDADDFSVQRN